MSRLTHIYENNSAFVRIDGDDIIDGLIDIQSAKLVIDGTQEVVGYFLKREDSELSKSHELNYPISTREGCWEIVIPFGTFIVGTVGGAVGGAFRAGLNAYAKTTGEKISEAQFGKRETREVFESAFRKLDVVIKIAQHLGVVDRKSPLNIKIPDFKSKRALLTNNQGNVLSVTTDDIEVYRSCPERLLRSLASVVTDYRTVSIGYHAEGITHESVIDVDTKEVFAPEDEPQEPILPELQDGEYVKLQGYVSRGNQITNTIGFKYKDHVITCEPNGKLITSYLNAHYKTCEIVGMVTRTTRSEVELGKRDRPKVIFDNLIMIDEAREPQQLNLIN